MTRRGGSRGGSSKKKNKGTRRALPMMSQSFVRYVRLLNQFRQVARSFTAPTWLNVPALLLYIHGQNKHDKGAMNVAKTMLLDQAAQMNPQIAGLLNAGAGDLGMLGLLGGFGGFNGGKAAGFGLPQPGPVKLQSDDGGDSAIEDATEAVELIEAIQGLNNDSGTVV